MSNRYDILVVGAGPAGSTASYYLAKSGLNVLMLDKDNFPRDKACGGGLCSHVAKFDFVDRSYFKIVSRSATIYGPNVIESDI